MLTIADKIKELPQAPGVYVFLGVAESAFGGHALQREFLYIGKATNLRSRVQSYFREAGVAGRSEWIERMVSQVADIDFEQTDSVLEALILESNLIKKHQPKYNTLEKDDKSFSYFVVTKEEFPKVLIVRKTDIQKNSNLKVQSLSKSKIQNKKSPSKLFGNWKLEIRNSHIYGPYTSKHQMEVALKIIRRIFPFHSGKQKTEKGCLDFQIGMCPGPYAGAISKTDYKKNIRGIEMILQGKKKSLVRKMEKEMEIFSKKQEFEKAAVLRNKIFALNHIRDVALIAKDSETEFYSKKLMPNKLIPARIEAYDISNISGTDAVGSMVVFENGAPDKFQYRKFKIKTVEGSNDVAMMKEVLSRRFKNDWKMPDLILLDGGVGHLNMAEKLLHEKLGLAVSIAGVAKGPTRKKLDIRRDLELQNNPNAQIESVLENDNLLKSIMDEAHRFAITYHRKLRRKRALAD